MNRSFWNKVAGARGKALACAISVAVVAALSSALMFVACQTDDPCTTNPNSVGCPGYVEPCPSTQVGCPGYVAPSDCDINLTPQCPNYCNVNGANAECCAANPNFTGCPTNPPNPCANGATAECCAANPSFTGCPTNPPGGDKYCRFEGNSSACYKIPTADHATPEACWAGYGEVVDNCSQATIGVYCRWTETDCAFTLGHSAGHASGAAHCAATSGNVVTSCAANPPPNPCANGATAECCAAQPSFTGCPTNPPNPCANGATAECCAAQPSFTGCPTNPPNPCANGATAECCAAQPSFTGCTPTNKKYCYWAANGGTCVEIGSEYCEEASCASEAGCTSNSGKVSTYSDCNDVVVTGPMQYCYWGPGECWPMAYPNDPDESNPNMTVLQACDAYGFVSNVEDCSDYVPPAESWYCYWDDAKGTGCVPIPKPDAVNTDNAPMTEKEVCDAYGFLTKSSTCADYVKPSITYYCDWGDGGCWKIPKPDGPCDAPCTGMTALENCEKNGKLYTAPNQPSSCK